MAVFLTNPNGCNYQMEITDPQNGCILGGIGKAGTNDKVIKIPKNPQNKKRSTEEATGKVSGDYVYLYPTELPILVPAGRADADAERSGIAVGRVEVEGTAGFDVYKRCEMTHIIKERDQISSLLCHGKELLPEKSRLSTTGL